MHPKSYEATSDEFPDLFLAFEEPDIQFATSSYYAFVTLNNCCLVLYTIFYVTVYLTVSKAIQP